MIRFLEKIRTTINEYENITKKNNFMTNPFNKASNKTIVWTDKKYILNK